jgi:hypothetical protein
VAKTFHMGVDVDGLALRLRCPMNCGCQACIQSHLIGVVPSHHSVWGGAALVRLYGGCEAPRVEMPDVVLITRVPDGQ